MKNIIKQIGKKTLPFLVAPLFFSNCSNQVYNIGENPLYRTPSGNFKLEKEGKEFIYHVDYHDRRVEDSAKCYKFFDSHKVKKVVEKDSSSGKSVYFLGKDSEVINEAQKNMDSYMKYVDSLRLEDFVNKVGKQNSELSDKTGLKEDSRRLLEQQYYLFKDGHVFVRHGDSCVCQGSEPKHVVNKHD